MKRANHELLMDLKNRLLEEAFERGHKAGEVFSWRHLEPFDETLWHERCPHYRDARLQYQYMRGYLTGRHEMRMYFRRNPQMVER